MKKSNSKLNKFYLLSIYPKLFSYLSEAFSLFEMFSSFLRGDLSDNEVDFLASEGRDYFLTRGMIYRNKSGNLEHRPFTVLPTPFPRRLFAAAREVQKDFNLLVHKASQDFQFTKDALLRYTFIFTLISLLIIPNRWFVTVNLSNSWIFS